MHWSGEKTGESSGLLCSNLTAVLSASTAAGPDSARRLFSAGCRRRLHCRRYCSLTARLPHPGAHKPKQLCNAMKCAETAWRWTGSAVRQGAVCSPVCWQQTSLLRCHHVTVFLFAGYFTCCIGVGLFTARWRFTLSCIWLRIFPTLCVTLLQPRQGHKSSQDPCLSKPIWSSPSDTHTLSVSFSF